MKLFGLGMPELVVILVVVLIIFGPKNLPKLGSALGRTVRGVREGIEGDESVMDGEFEEIEEDTTKTKKKKAKK